MKNIILALSLGFTLSSFAQTTVELTPWIPVDCKGSEVNGVNWIVKNEKVEETEDSVTFWVHTAIGSCRDRVMNVSPMTSERVMVELFEDKWFGSYVETGVGHNSDGTIIIAMKFNKKKIFKKKDSAHFGLFYYPQGYKTIFNPHARFGAPTVQKYGKYYPWRLQLTQNTPLDTELLVNVEDLDLK